MRHLQSLRNAGTVFLEDGSQIPVNYAIDITQKEIPTLPGRASIPSLKTLFGRVWSPTDATFVIDHFDEKLMLLLADGRKLQFAFQNSDGSIVLDHWIQ